MKFTTRIGGGPHISIDLDSIERIEWVDEKQVKLQYKSGVERIETFDSKKMTDYFMDLYIAIYSIPENSNLPNWDNYTGE